VAGITGLIAVPSMVVILLGMIYQHFQHDPNVKHLFAGLAAAAAGLLIQMAGRSRCRCAGIWCWRPWR
jgi:chromate transporter